MPVVAKKRRRIKKMIARDVKILLFTVLLGTSLYFFSQSSFFALEEIEVTGQVTLGTSEIIALTGLEKGMNLFHLPIQDVKKRLETHRLIETAQAVKKWPSTVLVTVKERKPCAIILAGSQFYIVDAQGYCLNKATMLKGSSFPVITGMKVSSLVPGKRINDPVLFSLLDVLKENPNQGFFSEFNIDNPKEIIVYTRTGIPVFLGSNEYLSDKLDSAKTFLLKCDLQKEEITYLDLRTLEAPAIKQKEEAS